MLMTRTEWALRTQRPRMFGGFGTGSVSTAWIGLPNLPSPGTGTSSSAPAPAPAPVASAPAYAPVAYSQSQGALSTTNPFNVTDPVNPPLSLTPAPAPTPSSTVPGGTGQSSTSIQVTAGAAPVAPEVSGEPGIATVLLYGGLALLAFHALKK